MTPNDTRRRPFRRYLVLFVGACAASLLLSPPAALFQEASGAPTQRQSQAQLTARLAPYLSQGTFGFAAKDLSTGRDYRLADDRVFDGGSTLKVVILAYLYHQASNNQFDLDETVTVNASDVQNYGTGSLRYQKMPQQLTYRELVKLAAKQSDNTAAFVLEKALDDERVRSFAYQLGLRDTDMSVDRHVTSPRDMLVLMEKIYRGEIADPALSRELMENLRQTDFEDRIPAKLPGGTVVYHKTGDAVDGGFHDIGIVEYQGTTYAVAIFTNAVPREYPADISQRIFEYMTAP